MNIPSLTLLERFVLESVAKAPKSFQNIQEDTGLSSDLIIPIISLLQKKQLLQLQQNSSGEYSLNAEKMLAWNKQFLSENGFKEEVKELLSLQVSSHFTRSPQSFLKLKKVYLTEEEKKILSTLFGRIEEFIRGVEKNPLHSSKRHQNLREKTVLFWGGESYGNLVEKCLQRI